MIQNPILRGFCPDPSILRAGADYYLATSTFEWWPGVKLFHSTDLKHWERLPGPLRREDQLNMAGDPTSGGVWAPCLSWDGTQFYLLFTDVKTKKGRFYNTHNYLVHAADPRGDWSKAVYLNSVGFDPSLFHDVDGRKYLINMVNGFRGILVQELETETFALVGPQKKVYDGSGIGCTEGPHMYHIGAWYYLLVAEGGTGYSHCVTLARSRSVWGPFETMPDNPLLTSDAQNPAALQKCGHADLVETQNGEWYLAHLCSRPLAGQALCPLGRETALQKLCWRADGWPELTGGGRFAKIMVEEPAGIPNAPFPESGPDFFTDFDADTLDVRLQSPRVPPLYSLTARPGWLCLTGRESLNSLHHVSLVAVSQEELAATAETLLDFAPKKPEQMAGLAYLYDAMNFYLLVQTANENGDVQLCLLKSDGGVITDLCTPIPLPAGPVELKAETSDDGGSVRFFYALNERWEPVGERQSTELVTDEHCRGFTGAQFGLYVHDMTGGGLVADFDYLHVSYKVRSETQSEQGG